ncbi:hypothetical protein THRCLA_10115, partial [Thraustotheca clavata]
MRIVMIHALRHSQAPIEAAFARLWPEASLANLLDDSLAADLAAKVAHEKNEVKFEEIQVRFDALSNYATKNMHADAILFTCSAFGSYIDEVAANLSPMPVLKPNEAMLADLIQLAGNSTSSPFVVALVATFAPTLTSMQKEINDLLSLDGAPSIRIVPVHIENALDALNAGDTNTHNELAAAKLNQIVQTEAIDAIALTQFSLAQSAPLVNQLTKKPVLTTPDSAVLALKKLSTNFIKIFEKTMEKKPLTDDWESDLAAIIEKTNQNLNLLRKIGEKRDDVPAKKPLARAKSQTTLLSGKAESNRSSITTDASIYKWKQVLDESTSLKRHIANKIMESTKAKEKAKKAATVAWEQSTNQDDLVGKETKAVPPYQPLMSLDEVKKSLQVDISSRNSVLEKQIADLRTDYQCVMADSQSSTLKIDDVIKQLNAKEERISSLEHSSQEQQNLLSRIDLQANHILKWKANMDHDLQQQSGKLSMIDNYEKKMQLMENKLNDFAARLSRQSELEDCLEKYQIRLAQLETKLNKSIDSNTLNHTVENAINKALQVYEERLNSRLNALSDMQETKNSSFLKTIQAQRENYEKAIQYALEASVGDLRNEFDSLQKRSDTRTTEMAASLDIRISGLSKRLATIETKTAVTNVEDESITIKRLNEAEDQWKKSMLRVINDSYVPRQQVTAIVMDELEARGTMSAWKRVENSISKMQREFEQKWTDTFKCVEELKTTMEETRNNTTTLHVSVQKSQQADTQALRSKLLHCITELEKLQNTKNDMDVHFARVEKERETQINRLSLQVKEVQAKRDADVKELNDSLHAKLLQIASTTGQIEVMKAAWKHEQENLKKCKVQLGQYRHEATITKTKLVTSEKEKAEQFALYEQQRKRLTSQLERLQQQWQAADNDRVVAQTSLQALLKENAIKQSKMDALTATIEKLQKDSTKSNSSEKELLDAMNYIATQKQELVDLKNLLHKAESEKAALEKSLQDSCRDYGAQLATTDSKYRSVLQSQESSMQTLQTRIDEMTQRHTDIIAGIESVTECIGLSPSRNDVLDGLNFFKSSWISRQKEWEDSLKLLQETSIEATLKVQNDLSLATENFAKERLELENKLLQQINDLNEILAEKQELEERVASLQEYESLNSNALMEIEAELERKTEAMERLRAELLNTHNASTTELHEKLHECSEQLAASEEDCERLTKEVNTLTKKINELESEIESHTLNGENAREEYERTLNFELDKSRALEAADAAHEAVIAKLKDEKAKLEADLLHKAEAKHLQAIAEVEKEKCELSNKLQEWSYRENQLQNELDEADKKLSSLAAESQLQIKALEVALKSQKDSTIAMETELAELIENLKLPHDTPLIEELRKHIFTLQEALNRSQVNVIELAEELTSLKIDSNSDPIGIIRDWSSDVVANLSKADTTLNLLREELIIKSKALDEANDTVESMKGDLAMLKDFELKWTEELAQCQAELQVERRNAELRTQETKALSSQLAMAKAAVSRCEDEIAWIVGQVSEEIEALNAKVDNLDSATEECIRQAMVGQQDQDQLFANINEKQDHLDALHSQLQTTRQQLMAKPMQLYQLSLIQNSLDEEKATQVRTFDEKLKEHRQLSGLESEWTAEAQVAYIQIFNKCHDEYIQKSVRHIPLLATRLKTIEESFKLKINEQTLLNKTNTTSPTTEPSSDGSILQHDQLQISPTNLSPTKSTLQILFGNNISPQNDNADKDTQAQTETIYEAKPSINEQDSKPTTHTDYDEELESEDDEHDAAIQQPTPHDTVHDHTKQA